jgi:endonuclease YncB( thermonuclease family)
VTRSLSGEGVEARLATGSLAEVRLLGVDAPSPKECGGADSRAALHELVAGRAVTLVSDPAHGPDVPGEPLPR